MGSSYGDTCEWRRPTGRSVPTDVRVPRTGCELDRMRAGLFNLQSGGHQVIVHIDDVTYTAE